MKLCVTTTSPFARKVLLLIKEHDMEDQFEYIKLHPVRQVESLQKITPLSKVPALITASGTLLVNSPIIARYIDAYAVSICNLESLVTPYDVDPEKVMHLESLSDEICSAAVKLTFERSRETTHQSEFWKSRWLSSINQTLAYLNEYWRKNALAEGGFHLGKMALISSLEYLSFRLHDVEWSTCYPTVAEWYSGMCERCSVIATQPVE